MLEKLRSNDYEVSQPADEWVLKRYERVLKYYRQKGMAPTIISKESGSLSFQEKLAQTYRPHEQPSPAETTQPTPAQILRTIRSRRK